MSQEKLILKKFNRLNYLKDILLSRSEEEKENIINEIKDIIDDIDLAIEDDDYRSDSKEDGYRAGRYFSLKDLKEYNGLDGNKAYVAVNGTVYDVTESQFWREGKHFGLDAGQDLTKEFYSCHSNNLEIANSLRVVGILKE